MKEFEGKKLLIIGAIKTLCPVVLAAQKMGAYVIVADYNEDAPAKHIADEAVLIDALDVDALVEYCQVNHVDGVTTGFVDILMPVYYEVCKRLHLFGYMTPKMISMSTNKVDFKNTCEKYGLNVPKTYLESNFITEYDYANIHYPVFVKPLDASGSRGADVCYDRIHLMRQFETAKSFSKTKTAVVEDYVTGTEFLLNIMAENGEFRVLSFFDRFKSSDRGNTMNFSNVAYAPSTSIDYYYENVHPKVVNMFKSEGFKDGIFFLQGFTTGNRITFFEMGCRLGGAYPQMEEVGMGHNAFDMVVRYALTGKMVPNISEIDERSAKYRKIALDCNFLLKKDEVMIAKVIGLDKIKALSSYVDVEFLIPEGTYFGKSRVVDNPVMSIYMLEDSMDDAKKTLAYINDVLDVVDENGDSVLSMKYDAELL